MTQTYRFPNTNSKDPEEHHFACGLQYFTRINPDPIFIEQLRELGWSKQEEKMIQNKQDIEAFITKNGYKPNGTSKNMEERRLGHLLNNYSMKRPHGCFDSEIAAKYKDIPTWQEYRRKKGWSIAGQ